MITSNLKAIFLALLVAFSLSTNAGEEGEHDHSHESHEHAEADLHADGHANKDGFDAGEMIMHHIADAHDWHILDWNGHPVSVPLPIVIYDKEKGLSVFLSSKFHHGESTYKGYGLSHGSIVAMDENHIIDETASANIIDLSITKNAFAILVSITLLILIMTSVAKSYARRSGQAPKGLQSFIEPIIIFVRDEVAKPMIGEHKYQKFMPFLLTLFFFIWINNILGLIPIFPGGANVTGNIAVPIVMAFFVFILTNINGNKNYWKHIFAMPGVPKPVLLILTPIEFLQIFIRPIVLVIRLFANITAGHISILVFFSLIFIFGETSPATGYGVSVASVAFTIFLNFLELLVGAIQAYVFTLLSAIYFGMAVAEEHH